MSILISIILYLKSRRDKRPYFNVRTFKLITDNVKKIEAIEIQFNGKRVQNLSLTHFALWNRGKDTINRQDVAPKDPLKILVVPPAELLAAEIMYTSNATNNFLISSNLTGGEISIDFDYFDNNEGLTIHIYHTGTNNDDIKLTGTIKGVIKITKVSQDESYFLSLFVIPIIIGLEKVIPSILSNVLISMLIVALFPLLLILILIDKVNNPLRRAPRQFVLLE